MKPALTKWFPPAALAVAAVASGCFMEGWVAMWTIAGALFLGAKWVTAYPLFGRAHFGTLLAYAILWPGLDALAFCDRRARKPPGKVEIISTIGKMLTGAVLLALSLRANGSQLAAGWCGMIGLVLLLHFGVFQFLSMFWRERGADARPIMVEPLRATSLGELWGQRWNAAFTTLMQRAFLKPLARWCGPSGAFFGIFLISGALHELVISVPARAGYGLPTLYFTLQGIGALFERSPAGRALNLGRGVTGWLFVVLVAGLPAFWLFPPIFIRRVILPMLQTFKALL